MQTMGPAKLLGTEVVMPDEIFFFVSSNSYVNRAPFMVNTEEKALSIQKYINNQQSNLKNRHSLEVKK